MGFLQNTFFRKDRISTLSPELMTLNIIHNISRFIAPRIEKTLLRKVLMILTIFSDWNTGKEMVELLKRI